MKVFQYWKEIIFGILPTWFFLAAGFIIPIIYKDPLAGLLFYYIVFSIPFSYVIGLIIKFVFKIPFNFKIVSIFIFVPVVILIILGIISLLFLANIS